MDSGNRHINFMCLNTPPDYAEGKLQLALPFYYEYRDVLPPKLSLHVKPQSCWQGSYVTGSYHITGLTKMMSFYGIKPYDIVIMQYLGEGHFNVKFYNAYGVEMLYQRENKAVNDDVKFSEVEIDKLHSRFLYNCYHNFLGIYNLTVEKEHLIEKAYTKVLSIQSSYELQLNESVKFITFAFKYHKWKIKLKWLDHQAWFSKKWFDFVREANISDGDVLAIYETDKRFKYQVCVVDKVTIDVQEKHPATSFFKFMSFDVFDNDEMEIPMIFANAISEIIGNVINIELGDGNSTQFKYCSKKKKIHGLRRFIGKYDIDEDYVLVFDYLGNANFALTVFDSQYMNHLRDVEGFYRFEDFMYPPIHMEVIDISDDDNNEENRMEGIMRAGEDDLVPHGNEAILQNALTEFIVQLQNSHVDQQCHGAYFPASVKHLYARWGKRTAVILCVGASNWTVDVLKRKSICRFAKGWDKFTKDNNLVPGQVISFQYIGDLRFEVMT